MQCVWFAVMSIFTCTLREKPDESDNNATRNRTRKPFIFLTSYKQKVTLLFGHNVTAKLMLKITREEVTRGY